MNAEEEQKTVQGYELFRLLMGIDLDDKRKEKRKKRKIQLGKKCSGAQSESMPRRIFGAPSLQIHSVCRLCLRFAGLSATPPKERGDTDEENRGWVMFDDKRVRSSEWVHAEVVIIQPFLIGSPLPLGVLVEHGLAESAWQGSEEA